MSVTWIPFSEQLPEDKQYILYVALDRETGCSAVYIGDYCASQRNVYPNTDHVYGLHPDAEWDAHQAWIDDSTVWPHIATHWAPVPALPKGLLRFDLKDGKKYPS